jgi:hypothetical protein
MKEKYYLEKLENKSLDPMEQYRLMTRLETKLFDSDFSQMADEKQFEKDGLKIDLKYNNCQYNPTISEAEERLISTEDQEREAKKWRTLNNISINYNQEGKDLVSLLPEDWQIIFKSSPPDINEGGANFRYKTIFIGKPDNFRNILALTHEIGHAMVFHNLDKDQRQDFLAVNDKFQQATRHGKQLDKDTINEILKSERDAWAVGIKLLKPIIKAGLLTKDDLSAYIHSARGGALETYSTAIKKLIDEERIA